MTLKSLSICGLLLLASTSAASAQETTATASAAKTVSGGVLNGKAKNLVIPAYPAAARAVNAAGAVNVQITVDETGAVISAAAVSGHPLLRASAVQAARASEFVPTLLDNQPVKVSGVIVYSFTGDNSQAAANRVGATQGDATRGEHKWVMAGAMLSGLTLIDGDGDSGRILIEMSNDKIFAAYPEEKQKLASLPRDAQARQQTIRGVGESLESKLTGVEAWEFALGKNIVGVMMQVRNPNAKEAVAPDPIVLRDHLSKIRELALAPPVNYPAALTEKVRTLGAFADKPDLTDAATVNELTTAFAQLLSSVGTVRRVSIPFSVQK